MGYSRFILERDIVDNLTTDSSILPLSASMGVFLQEEINNLSPGGSEAITSVVIPGQDGDFNTISIGTLRWVDSNNDIILDLTDTTVNKMTVFRVTDNYSGPAEIRQLTRGSFAVSGPASYWLTSDGVFDSALSIPTDISQVHVMIGFTTGTLFENAYFLDMIFQRTDNNEIVASGTFNTIKRTPFIGVRMEANGFGGVGSPLYSFGGQEDTDSVGFVAPFNATFTEISYQLPDGMYFATSLTMEVYKNGVKVSEFQIKSGLKGGIATLTPSVGCVANDLINFKTGAGTVANQVAIDSILRGEIQGL